MTLTRLCASRPRVGVLAVVLLGMSAVPADAQGAAALLTDSTSLASADLPATLTALRVEILVPPGRSPERPPRPRDQWWARDKARHVVFSGLLTLSTQYVLVRKADWSQGDALPLSAAASGALGITKELYDASRVDGRASGKDLVADAMGIGLAVGVVLL